MQIWNTDLMKKKKEVEEEGATDTQMVLPGTHQLTPSRGLTRTCWMLPNRSRTLHVIAIDHMCSDKEAGKQQRLCLVLLHPTTSVHMRPRKVSKKALTLKFILNII